MFEAEDAIEDDDEILLGLFVQPNKDNKINIERSGINTVFNNRFFMKTSMINIVK
jgi:hypothetical protein